MDITRDKLDKPVLLTIEAGVARIRFNRPTALNAIDVPLANAFFGACDEIKRCAEVRVVVLSGEGRAFMAGGDLQSFWNDLPAACETARALIDPMHAALKLLTALPQPVIASVHGSVAGAGVSVALACDLVIAADNARFSLAYPRIGTSIDCGGSWALPRIVGLHKALELSLLGDTVDAPEALALGLVNRVVPYSALAGTVEALVTRCAGGSTIAYGRIKKLLRGAHQSGFSDQLDAERNAFCDCISSPDFAEGIQAFIEKRQPNFVGR